MAKILIIPDIHHKVVKVNSLIAHESHDKVIFLGDYFDDYNDVFEDAYRTATWLKNSLQYPNRIHLIGNHDIAYMYPFNKFLYCSGFSNAKDYAIWSVLNREDFDKLKLYHIEDGIIFSHAGISQKLINKYAYQAKGRYKTLEQVQTLLTEETPKAFEKAANDSNHYLLNAGWSRGGMASVGGIIWGDFDIDFLGTPFPQIVGHTPHPKPLFHLRTPKASRIEVLAANEAKIENLVDKWWALGLDSHLNHYAILEDGILTIKEISWSGIGSSNVNYTFEIFKEKII